MGVVLLTAIIIVIISFIAHSIINSTIKIRMPKSNNGFTYFSPQASVNWFDFYSLYKSFLKIADTGKTLTIIDKREVISTFQNDNVDAIKMAESENEKWIDFLADTGDGFDSTTTLFYYLTRNELISENELLKRGSTCIVGGDLVYPDASEDEYNNRFKGPIRLVLPFNSNNLDKERSKPKLIATPGNHDWYDGCSAFIRMMCQQKSIGGFETIQHKTYFAFTLLENLQVLGIDNQLMGDIDIPQLNYFKNYVGSLSKNMKQNILLVVAEPYWYNYNFDEKMQYRQRLDSLEYLISELKRSNKDIVIKAILTGDIHHYARYKCNDKSNDTADKPMLITSGGGGAFKHMTHKLEKLITIPSFEIAKGNKPSPSISYENVKHYPSFEWSKKHMLKNVAFAFKNLSFTLTLGLFLWLVLAISGWHAFPFRYTHYISGILVLPGIFITLLSAVESKETSQKSKNKFNQLKWLFFIIIAVINCIILVYWIPINVNSFKENEYIVNMLIVGLKCGLIAILNNTLFGIFLLIRFNWTGKNHTEASSSNVESGYNNFIRMKVTKEKITFYVIGIDKVLPFKKHILKNRKIFQNGEGTLDKSINEIFPSKKLEYKIVDKFEINLD